MRSILATIAVGVVATTGCVERDGMEVSLLEWVQTNNSDDHSANRPDFLVGTWRWAWSYTGEDHSLVLHRDGQAARITDNMRGTGTWHVRDDGILAVSLDTKNYRIDSNSDLRDMETTSTDREGRRKKVANIPFKKLYLEGPTQSPAEHCPASLIGVWRGPPQHNSLYLHQDGQAVKERNASWSSGRWQMRDDGVVAISLTMEFQIDSNASLVDIGTLSMDRDFPWFKADTKEMESRTEFGSTIP